MILFLWFKAGRYKKWKWFIVMEFFIHTTWSITQKTLRFDWFFTYVPAHLQFFLLLSVSLVFMWWKIWIVSWCAKLRKKRGRIDFWFSLLLFNWEELSQSHTLSTVSSLVMVYSFFRTWRQQVDWWSMISVVWRSVHVKSNTLGKIKKEGLFVVYVVLWIKQKMFSC